MQQPTSTEIKAETLYLKMCLIIIGLVRYMPAQVSEQQTPDQAVNWLTSETYCKIILTDGLGLPSVDNVSVPMTNGSKQYLYSNHKSEYFSIQVSFKGDELGDIMSSRNGFANLIKPNVTAYNEPLVLRYQGYDDNGVAASDPVDIKCNYVSGLDKSPLRRFVHFADITFELYEPTIQVDGEEAAELDFNDTLANADYIVKRDRDGVWSAMAGVTGEVYAMHNIQLQKKFIWW